MKYWREMLARGFTGKTGWGKEIPVKWRLGALRHIITSLLFVEGTRRALGWDYKRVALFGALPTYLSPPAQIVTGLYNYMFGKHLCLEVWLGKIFGKRGKKEIWKNTYFIQKRKNHEQVD